MSPDDDTITRKRREVTRSRMKVLFFKHDQYSDPDDKQIAHQLEARRQPLVRMHLAELRASPPLKQSIVIPRENRTVPERSHRLQACQGLVEIGEYWRAGHRQQALGLTRGAAVPGKHHIRRRGHAR